MKIDIGIYYGPIDLLVYLVRKKEVDIFDGGNTDKIKGSFPIAAYTGRRRRTETDYPYADC
jgi:hypothetical protein